MADIIASFLNSQQEEQVIEQVRSRADQQAMQAAVAAAGLYMYDPPRWLCIRFAFRCTASAVRVRTLSPAQQQQPTDWPAYRMAYGKGTSTQTVISRNPLARHRGEYDLKHLRVAQLHLHPHAVGDVQAALSRFHRHFADRTDLTGVPPLVRSCACMLLCFAAGSDVPSAHFHCCTV